MYIFHFYSHQIKFTLNFFSQSTKSSIDNITENLQNLNTEEEEQTTEKISTPLASPQPEPVTPPSVDVVDKSEENGETEHNNVIDASHDSSDAHNADTNGTQESHVNSSSSQASKAASVMADDVSATIRKPPTFQLSKQHTGMKNRSVGVGMAVTPSNKMEFDQEDREEFGVLKINRPIGHKLSPETNQDQQPLEDAVSTVSSTEGLTDQGYYDLKFYHNKLW